jgi:hypothetical protein
MQIVDKAVFGGIAIGENWDPLAGPCIDYHGAKELLRSAGGIHGAYWDALEGPYIAFSTAVYSCIYILRSGS